MSYVIALETDGTARDVTRRYVKAYNAKTRKNRIEVTKGGERWWRRVLKLFDRPYDLDRDQVEDAELAAKEAAEEMPRNVQDFKDHPYYALERHLRRNEVIHPKREVGKVTAGKAGSSGSDKALKSIYRRRDVHIVKSADSWYRLGREIKPGEQPLKRVQPRRGREARVEDEEQADEEQADDDEEGAGTGLYAPFQTVAYEAPPVVNGRIPKNEYGNLDIYVPTMVPKGGIHIVHPETARAAKILGIDYADAVTGFEFRGRHGTAVIKGAVVAAEYAEAVQAVLSGFEDQRAEAEELRRSHEAIRMWKRFMIGLRIKERIEGYDVEGDRDVVKEELDKVDEIGDEEGGGFLPDRDEALAEPTVARSYQLFPADFEDEGGGFLPESPVNGAGNISVRTEGHVMPGATIQAEDIGGGGYLSDAIDKDAEEALRETEIGHTKGDDYRAFSRKGPAEQTDGKGAFPSEDAEQGGGFIVDDDSANDEETPSQSNILPQTTASLGLTDHELAEATMLQQMHESKGENIPHAEIEEKYQAIPVVPEQEDIPAGDGNVEGKRQHVLDVDE